MEEGYTGKGHTEEGHTSNIRMDMRTKNKPEIRLNSTTAPSIGERAPSTTTYIYSVPE